MDVLQTMPVTMPYGGQDPQAVAAQARSGNKTDPKAIETVAKGFEGIFASMMIKQMRQSLEPTSMFGHDTGDVLGGLFDLFMGQHMAQAGGLGIGQIVKQQLMPPASRKT
jgi:flagellar protein FlgJ